MSIRWERYGPDLRRVLPYFLLTTASFFWAGNVVAGRALSMPGPDRISPAVLNSLRWSIALIALAPFVLPGLRTQWIVLVEYRSKLLCLGALGIAGYYLLFYMAVETVPAIEAGLLVGAMPAVITGLAVALGTERATPLRVTGLTAAILGSLATVATHEASGSASTPGAGHGMIVAAVLCWSTYTILLQRWKLPISTLILTFTTASWGLLVTLLAAGFEIVTRQAIWHGTESDLLLTLYVGLFPAIGSTLCWNAAVRSLGSGTPAVFLTLIPVFSTALAAVLLHEPIGFYDVACLLLVVFGVALVASSPSAAFKKAAMSSTGRLSA